MTNKEWIELFFCEAYEKQINELLLEDREYEIPYNTIYNYVKQVIGIPYTEFLDFLIEYGNVSYNKRDIPQYIKFNHCEDAMIQLLIDEDNTGLKPFEIGELLCENYKRSSRSYVNYANRHLISAKILGIVFEYFGHWYLNCIGYVYINLEPMQKKSLLARTLLRSPFFKSIFSNNPEQIVLSDILEILPYGFVKNNYIAITSLINICIQEADNCNKKINFIDQLSERVLFRKIFNYNVLKKKSSSLSYSIYLNKVMSWYYMNEKEALQLFYRYKNGDKYALEEIVKNAQSIVFRIASSYQFAPFEDIIQEGNLGLLEGIERYDPQKYPSFYGFLSFWVKRHIQSCKSDISSLIHVPANVLIELNAMEESFDHFVQINEIIPSINDLEFEEFEDHKKIKYLYNLLDILSDMTCFVDDLDSFQSNLPPTDEFQESEYNTYVVNNLLQNLSKRDNEIVKANFGIDSNTQEESLDNIGIRFGLTRERVRQIVINSCSKMRENARKKRQEAIIGDIIQFVITEQVGKVFSIKNAADGSPILLVKMESGYIEEVFAKAPTYEVLSRTIKKKHITFPPPAVIQAKEEEKPRLTNSTPLKSVNQFEVDELDGVKVGDRIVYNNKDCTICKILIKGSSSRLLIKYDNEVLDYVQNDKSKYRIVRSKKKTGHKTEKPSKQQVLREASVGDRIIYDSKFCTVLRKKITKTTPYLIVQYDDGTIDYLQNDMKRYRIV